jgi:hypothetical protein
MRDKKNEAAVKFLTKLSSEQIDKKPWARVGATPVDIALPDNFIGQHRNAEQFLIDLRNAIAHGDARTIEPFHVESRNGGAERLLVGFTFHCSKENKKGDIVWRGKITLLEDDMRRIGSYVAKMYCNALRRSKANCRDGHFGSNAARFVREAARESASQLPQ